MKIKETAHITLSESKEELFSNGSDNFIHPGWLEFKDLLLHPYLFEEWGLLAVTAHGDSESLMLADDDFFYLGDRRLEFSEKPTASAKKVKQLLEKLSLSDLSRQSIVSSRFISNPGRREEIFVPFLLKRESELNQPQEAMYIYPWLSRGNVKNFSFKGFTRYVTAGCLFGANLKAQDQNGTSWPLVKHNHQFFDEQTIDRIVYNIKESNAYEATLFAELKNSVRMMKQLANKKKPVSCLYHLPYYDYMLFGVALYTQKRILIRAFNKLICTIETKRIEHTRKISEIFDGSGIHPDISSPFDELFYSVANDKITGDCVLKLLGHGSGVDDPASETEPNLMEEKLVLRCLETLTTSGKNKQIWLDLVAKSEDKPNSLEYLFKMANAYMIAKAAFGCEDYAACSLLPATEKQIQLSYVKFAKSYANKHSDKLQIISYPSVFNITVLDSVLGYNPLSRGRLFYFDACKDNLTMLIEETNILSAAHRNAACKFFKPSKAHVEPSVCEAIALSSILEMRK